MSYAEQQSMSYLREIRDLLIEIRDILREEQASLAEIVDEPAAPQGDSAAASFVHGVQEAFRIRQQNYPYG